MVENKKQLPLAGIRVIELATVVAAPTAGRLLADYGAEVIKVETPGAGDLQRYVGDAHQLPIEKGNNPLFDTFNAGKRLTAINLKTEGGMAVMKKLLATADVFISNVRMPSLVKMGLGYDDLKEDFPQLIYAHFSGFGLKGRDVNKPGFDMSAYWLRCGMTFDWVTKGSFPMRATYGFGDIATSGYLVSGILMAIIGRQTSGRGTFLSVSLLGCGVWQNTTHVVNTQKKYGRELPVDRYDPWDPFSDFYQCGDGKWAAIVKKNYAKDKASFAKIFNFPELLTDERYASLSSMRKAGLVGECVRRVEEAMLTKPRDEWEQIFKEVDIPFECAHTSSDVWQDDQVWANGYLENVDYGDGEPTAVPTPPIQFDNFGRRAFTKEGEVGADTDVILDELGYSAEDIAALKAARCCS